MVFPWRYIHLEFHVLRYVGTSISSATKSGRGKGYVSVSGIVSGILCARYRRRLQKPVPRDGPYSNGFGLEPNYLCVTPFCSLTYS